MEAEHFDLVVIGSGPAGERGAAQAAYFGKRVALVEREPVLGGAAANTGTLPSKTLRETSLMLSGMRARETAGVDLAIRREATVRSLMHRERTVVGLERLRINHNLDRHRITLVRGEASFADANTLRVVSEGRERLLKADVVLVATGSRPRRPDTFPFDSGLVYDSDDILQLQNLPERLVVIGGGVIGSEYACIFAALGVRVCLVDKRTRLLGFLDHEVSDTLTSSMAHLGIELTLGEEVEAVHTDDQLVAVTLKSGQRLNGDALLVAAGRLSNVESLNLEAAGVETGNRGLIKVNDKYQTSVPHIYAAGDVIGFPALASTSMEQARVAMVDAFDLKYKTSVAEILPYGIYTIPEVSMAGETEESLQEKGIDYVAGKATYLDNARGTIIGDDRGFLKLLFAREDRKLLGVHVIGEIASEVVHIGLMALMSGATGDLFIRTCFNYPTLGQMYKYATYDAMGKLSQD